MYVYTNYGVDPTPTPPAFVGPQPEAFGWGQAAVKASLIFGGLWLFAKAFEKPDRPRRRPARRDTYLYRLLTSGRSAYYGISNQPERRCVEHLASGKRFSSMEVLGVAVSRDTALARERTALDGHCQRYGRLPRYNKI